MKACPKCGGVDGYEAVLVMRYTMTGAWGEEWETSGDEWATYRSPSVRCTDCNGRVPLAEATGSGKEVKS